MLFNSTVVLINFYCLEPLAVEGCGVKTSVFTCVIIGNMGLQGGLWQWKATNSIKWKLWVFSETRHLLCSYSPLDLMVDPTSPKCGRHSQNLPQELGKSEAQIPVGGSKLYCRNNGLGNCSLAFLTAPVFFYLGQMNSSVRWWTLQEIKDTFLWVISPGTGRIHLQRKVDTKPVIQLLRQLLVIFRSQKDGISDVRKAITWEQSDLEE